MIETGLLVGDGSGSELSLSDSAMALINESQHKTSFIKANRRILEETLFNQIEPHRAIGASGDQQDLTVIDILLDGEIQPEFIEECEHLLVFSEVYDALIADLVAIAREAQTSRCLLYTSDAADEE